MKVCKTCKVEYPRSNFYKWKYSADKLTYSCKSCTLLQNKKNREKNKNYFNEKSRERYKNLTLEQKEKRKIAQKNWLKNNLEKRKESFKKYDSKNKDKRRVSESKRRSKKRNNGEFLVLKKEALKIIASPCVICGSKKEIQIDHIIPIARGGRHSIGNLQPLCSYHNLRKGKMLMKEYMIKLSKEAIENE